MPLWFRERSGQRIAPARLGHSGPPAAVRYQAPQPSARRLGPEVVLGSETERPDSRAGNIGLWTTGSICLMYISIYDICQHSSLLIRRGGRRWIDRSTENSKLSTVYVLCWRLGVDGWLAPRPPKFKTGSRRKATWAIWNHRRPSTINDRFQEGLVPHGPRLEIQRHVERPGNGRQGANTARTQSIT